jgi:hypothetical protein
MALKPYFVSKDLAQLMQVSPRTVPRLAKELGVPPTVNRHACMRWSFEDARKFLDAWENRKSRSYGPEAQV